MRIHIFTKYFDNLPDRLQNSIHNYIYYKLYVEKYLDEKVTWKSLHLYLPYQFHLKYPIHQKRNDFSNLIIWKFNSRPKRLDVLYYFCYLKKFQKLMLFWWTIKCKKRKGRKRHILFNFAQLKRTFAFNFHSIFPFRRNVF